MLRSFLATLYFVIISSFLFSPPPSFPPSFFISVWGIISINVISTYLFLHNEQKYKVHCIMLQWFYCCVTLKENVLFSLAPFHLSPIPQRSLYSSIVHLNVCFMLDVFFSLIFFLPSFSSRLNSQDQDWYLTSEYLFGKIILFNVSKFSASC